MKKILLFLLLFVNLQLVWQDGSLSFQSNSSTFAQSMGHEPGDEEDEEDDDDDDNDNQEQDGVSGQTGYSGPEIIITPDEPDDEDDFDWNDWFTGNGFQDDPDNPDEDCCPICLQYTCQCCINCKSFPCHCCKKCHHPVCVCCSKCRSYPCICCKRCNHAPCVCCKKCYHFPCICCKTCYRYPCKCCKICKHYPCKCCETCNRYPCQCSTFKVDSATFMAKKDSVFNRYNNDTVWSKKACCNLGVRDMFKALFGFHDTVFTDTKVLKAKVADANAIAKYIFENHPCHWHEIPVEDVNTYANDNYFVMFACPAVPKEELTPEDKGAKDRGHFNTILPGHTGTTHKDIHVMDTGYYQSGNKNTRSKDQPFPTMIGPTYTNHGKFFYYDPTGCK